MQTASLSLGRRSHERGKRTEPSARLEPLSGVSTSIGRGCRSILACAAIAMLPTLCKRCSWRAHQREADFRGTTREELAAWLRQILANTLADVLRNRLHVEPPRPPPRSESRKAALDQSSLHFWRHVRPRANRVPAQSCARKKTPCGWRKAAMQLPELQREAVTLKHLESRPLVDVANLMGRSPASVASLLRRGLARPSANCLRRIPAMTLGSSRLSA